MEGEEIVKQTTCIEIETTTTTNEQGEDVQVYYLNVPDSEDAQVLDISNILAQEGIQIVETDGLNGDSQTGTVLLEADGSLSNDQSATQSAQALLNLSKAHSHGQASASIKVVDVLDVNNQIPTEVELAEHVQLSEPVTATYVVDENGTMVPLSEYRDTHGSTFLEVEDPASQTVAVCTCWCGKEFFSQEDLDKHKLMHTKRRVRGSAQLKCELCSEIFNSTSKLANHHRIVHPDGMPWECPICFRRFTKKLGLKVHLRAHSGLKQHKCSYCERGFSYKNALLRHIRLHTKDKPYKCTICGELFAHMWAMRRHRAIHRPKHLFQCDLCSKTFKQKQTLFIHARVHTGHKPYTCDICRKAFTLKSSLNQHLRIHTGERPKVCPICQKAFRQTSTLKSHMKLHSHLKPHKCRYCKQRFSLHEEMLEHENVHLSNKSWQCEECGMRFRNQSLLSRHIRKHTNERPFQCKICGKSFSQSGSLQSHMRTHTKEKPYQCRLCPKMYTTSGTLLLHIRRAHNLDAKSVKDVFPTSHYVEDQKVFTIPTPVPALRTNMNVSSTILDGEGDEKTVSDVLGKDELVFEEVVGSSQDDVITSDDGNVIIQRINPLMKGSGVQTQDKSQVVSDLNDLEEEAGDSTQVKGKNKRKKVSVKELMTKRNIKAGSLTLMNVDSLGRYKVIDMEKENSLYAQARQEAALGLAELSLVGGVVVSEKKSGTAYRTLARESDNDTTDDPSVTKIILSKEGGIMNSQDPHQCPECKRIFGRKSIMVEHRRIHTDEKPYKCDYCPGGFRQSAQLTCHIRNKHTKEKRYQCTFCQKKFLSHSITVRHINFHHKLKVRVCESMCQGWKVDDAIFVEKKEAEPVEENEGSHYKDDPNSMRGDNRGTMKYGRKSNITILNSLTGLGSPTVKVKFGTDKKKAALKSSSVNNKDNSEDTTDSSPEKATDVNTQAVEDIEGDTLFGQIVDDKEAVIGTWYVCETCAMQFNSMDSLRWHLKQVHNTTLAESDVSYVFEDEPLGNVTKESEVGVPEKDSTGTNDSLVIKQEEEESENCVVLSEPASVKNSNSINESQPNNVKPTLVCCMCSTYCTSRVELEQHMMSHENEDIETAGLHRCDTCGVVMKNTQQISKHILKVHGVENIFGCSICDKEFFQESSVVRHMKFFHKWEMKIRGEGNIPVLLKPASDHLRHPGAGDRDKVKGKVKVDPNLINRPTKNEVKVSSRYENDMTFISLEVGDLDQLQLYREDGQEVRFEVVSSTEKATVIRIKDPQRDLNLSKDSDSSLCIAEDLDDSQTRNVSTDEVYIQEDISNSKVSVVPATSTDLDKQVNVIVMSEQSGQTDEVVFHGELNESMEDHSNGQKTIADLDLEKSAVPSTTVHVTSNESDRCVEAEHEDTEESKLSLNDKTSSRIEWTANKEMPKQQTQRCSSDETNTSPDKTSNVSNENDTSSNLNINTQVRVVTKNKEKYSVGMEEKNNSNTCNVKVRTISVLNNSPSHTMSSHGSTSPMKKPVVRVEKLTAEQLSNSRELCINSEIVGSPSKHTIICNDDEPATNQAGKKKRGRPSKISSSGVTSPMIQTEKGNNSKLQLLSPKLQSECVVTTPKTSLQETQPSHSSSGRLIKRKRFADEEVETSLSPRKPRQK